MKKCKLLSVPQPSVNMSGRREKEENKVKIKEGKNRSFYMIKMNVNILRNY